MKIFVTIILTFIFVNANAAQEIAHNRMDLIYKEKKELLLDNDKVQVYRLTYLPGAESGEHKHQHPSRVVYVLKAGRIALINSDKHSGTKIVELTEGQTLYLPANHHNVKNVGKTTVVLLETEIKDKH